MRSVRDKLTYYWHRNGPEIHANDILGMYTSRWATRGGAAAAYALTGFTVLAGIAVIASRPVALTRRAASGLAELTAAVRLEFVPVLRSGERGPA